MYDSKLLNVYAISLLDLFAVGLTVPLISSHLRSLGASHFIIGFFQSTYSLLQVLSGPFFGSLSDTKGRVFVLVLITASCSFAYFFLGLSTSLYVFFLLRVFIGIIKHTQTLCKAALTDIVPEERHAEALGYYMALSSLGFVIGPLIGGYLSEYSHGFFLVTCLTSLVFLCNLGLVLCLPFQSKTQKLRQTRRNASVYYKIYDSISEACTSLTAVDWKEYWDALLLRLLFGLSTSIYFSNQTTYIQERYHLSQRYIGFTVSFFSGVGVLSSLLLGFVTKTFYADDISCSKRLFHNYFLMTASLVGLYFSPSLVSFLLILIPYSISSSVLRIVSMELMLTRSVKDNMKGCLAGASNSIMSVARLLTPVTTGFLLDWFGEHFIMLFATVPALAGMVLSWRLSNLKMNDTKVKVS